MSRVFDDWLKAYMLYSAHSEAPDKFHFWTGISVIAGALRRRVWMDMGYFQWTPNFYIIFVAPPGIVSKSTTANIGMRLLKRVEGIKFGPDAVTWQALAQSLALSQELFEVPAVEPDGEKEWHSMSSLTIVSSEFGTFLNPQDREMVDVLVSLWDGQVGAWKKATKTMGDDNIINPWVNVLACTTPDWIARNFPEAMIGGGFTSRCIFVYADVKRQLVAYPKYHLPKEHYELEEALIRDLEDIAVNMVGEIHLSPEAREFGEEWYDNHYQQRPAHLDNERFAGYLARKQTHIHKLAIVLSAAQSNDLTISRETLEASAAIVSVLEEDMPKVFKNIGKTQESRNSDLVLAYVFRAGKVDMQDLYRRALSHVTYKEFEAVVSSCVAAGYMKVADIGGRRYLVAVRKNDEGGDDGNGRVAAHGSV